MTEGSPLERAPRVYRESIVIDCLCNMDEVAENAELVRRAGVTAIQHTVVPFPKGVLNDFPLALKDIARNREFIDAHSDRLTVATRGEDIRAAEAENRTAIVMGLQDPKPIRDEIVYVRTLYDLGLRCIQLTHNTQNYIGTGCAERDDGLSEFGKKIVREMNRLGMMIDISHCGPQTSLDAIACSEVPVICTHSNPRAVAPHFRNKPDEVIENLAERGGVIGIMSWAPGVYKGSGGRPTLADVLDCFDYAIDLVGPKHVAIGTDTNEQRFLKMRDEWEKMYGRQGIQASANPNLPWYNVETWYAEGLESLTHLPDLARGLLDRGHPEDALRGILGENVLRLMDDVCG